MAPQANEAAAWVSVFRRHMDEMLNVIYQLREQGGSLHEFSPLMDIYETAEHFIVELDLPGFADKDFAATTNGQTLRVDGIKRHEKSESAMSFICLERHFGRFTTTVEIPAAFDPAGMQTVYLRGVLSVKFPRR
jgi:HSP20 family protein